MPTVAISIPKRPEYGNTYYALQKAWASGGPYILDVTDAQLEELRRDPVLTLIEDGDKVALAAASPAAAPEAAEKPGKPLKR